MTSYIYKFNYRSFCYRHVDIKGEMDTQKADIERSYEDHSPCSCCEHLSRTPNSERVIDCYPVNSAVPRKGFFLGSVRSEQLQKIGAGIGQHTLYDIIYSHRVY